MIRANRDRLYRPRRIWPRRPASRHLSRPGERFEAERQAQVIELAQDIIGGEIVLSVAPTSPDLVQVERNEIRLEDGRRIVLRLRRPHLRRDSS